MRLFFDDVGFDGQLQRSVGKCDAGMASVGECLYVASQITLGDRDSWYRAWSQFADGLVQQADQALAVMSDPALARRLEALVEPVTGRHTEHVEPLRRPEQLQRRLRRPLVR